MPSAERRDGECAQEAEGQSIGQRGGKKCVADGDDTDDDDDSDDSDAEHHTNKVAARTDAC